MKDIQKLIALIKERHGANLDLNNEDYVLYLKDGIFKLSLDEEKTLKVELEFNDSTKVYFTNKTIDEVSADDIS